MGPHISERYVLGRSNLRPNTYLGFMWHFTTNIYIYIYIFEKVLTYDVRSYYHQIKTPINFLCSWRLNLRSLIQPSKTLSVELTETHATSLHIYIYICILSLFANIIHFFFFPLFCYEIKLYFNLI